MAPIECRRFTGVRGGQLSSPTTVHSMTPLMPALPAGTVTFCKALRLSPNAHRGSCTSCDA
eukprot:9816968-Lingulodinium_polyedra.AAC.1